MNARCSINTTRDRILDAAIELLWLQSYGAVSVDSICQHARIQKGSFYHYFPSKVDVVIEAYEKLWRDKQSVLDGIFFSNQLPLERLSQYCRLAYDMQKGLAEQHGKVLGCPYMTCGSELSTQEERIPCKIDEIFNRSARYFEVLMNDIEARGAYVAEDKQMISHEMLAYVCGVMYQAKLKNDAEIIRRDLEAGLLRYLSPLPRLAAHTPQTGTSMLAEIQK